jgi:hypothetical protein
VRSRHLPTARFCRAGVPGCAAVQHIVTPSPVRSWFDTMTKALSGGKDFGSACGEAAQLTMAMIGWTSALRAAEAFDKWRRRGGAKPT